MCTNLVRWRLLDAGLLNIEGYGVGFDAAHLGRDGMRAPIQSRESGGGALDGLSVTIQRDSDGVPGLEPRGHCDADRDGIGVPDGVLVGRGADGDTGVAS